MELIINENCEGQLKEFMGKYLFRLISYICLVIISHWTFELFILLVIIANSIALAFEDPTEENQDYVLETMDMIFIYIYTVECGLKVNSK